MFRSRRRSASSHVDQRRNSNSSSAASAAALAYLNRQNSDANLSAAAAAAALRSHVTTPEPVGNIRTQRMIRRGSTSSVGSGTGSVRQPFASNLQRRGSNGSMTERSFRTPSPGRNAPPIPTIPEVVPPIPTKSHKRTPSQEEAAKPTLPNPSNVGRQMTVGRSPSTKQAPQTQPLQQASVSGATPSVATPRERSDSQTRSPSSQANRQSVNFSRPMSPPPAPSARMAQELNRQRPASSLGFQSLSAAAVQRPLTQGEIRAGIAETKKQQALAAAGQLGAQAAALNAAKARPASALGRSLSVATRSTSAQSTPARPASANSMRGAAQEPLRPGAPVITKPDPNAISESKVRATNAAKPRPVSAYVRPPPPTAEQVRVFQTRAAAQLARPRAEAIIPLANSGVPNVAKATPAALPVSSALTPQPRTVSQPLPTLPYNAPHTNGKRDSSVGSTRSAHFLDKPYLDAVKHEPLSRAASPGKPALKGSMRHHSPGPPSVRSGMSDTSENPSDEGIDGKRKRTAHVSFDERAAVVGEGIGGPSTPNGPLSPQIIAKIASIDDEDAKLSPRPALPMFGSVRLPKSPTPDVAQVPETAKDATSISSDAQESPAKFLSSLPPTIPAIEVLPSSPVPEQDPGFASSTIGAIHAITDDVAVPASAPIEPLTQSAEVETNGVQYDSDDAVEDFKDAEEDQIVEPGAPHASLDAIQESPAAELASPMEQSLDAAVQPVQATVVAPIAPTSLPTVPEASTTAPPDDNDWENVKAYWSGLSEQRKQQLELEAAKLRESRDAAATEVEPVQPKVAETAPTPPWPSQGYQDSVAAPVVATASEPVAQGARHVRNTSEPHLRSSMRAEKSPVGMRSSLRSRPASQHGPITQPTGLSASASAAALSKAAPKSALKPSPLPAAKPALQRANSGDSDGSESSFRKKRRSKPNGSDGRYTMRRSMRGAPEPAASVATPASARNSRLLSPSPSRSMRSSLRSPKGAEPETRSLRNRLSTSGAPKPKPAKANGSRFGSRFADSSDEDEPVRSTWRSRFDDSDELEDDVPQPLPVSPQKFTPVRGIPRKAGQADSPDLSESEFGDGASVVTPGTASAPISATVAGAVQPASALSAGTLREPATPSSPASIKSKRNIFGIKRRSTVIEPGTIAAINGTLGTTTSESLALAPDPAAAHTIPKTMRNRSETPERGRGMFRRRFSMSSNAAPSPSRSTLQVDQLALEDRPPVPPVPAEYKADQATVTAPRPATSDGTPSMRGAGAVRPTLDKRHSTMTSTTSNKPVVFSERTGKKKKFQGLRRLFGVYD